MVILWAVPYGQPKVEFRDRLERCEPENFVREFRGCRAQRCQAAFRIRDNENSKLCVSKLPFEISGDRVAEIRLDLCAPHGPAFVPEVYFEKCSERFPRGFQLYVPIGDQRNGWVHRFVET